jgi:poly(3-hydroxybutyrate) depolymerase
MFSCLNTLMKKYIFLIITLLFLLQICFAQNTGAMQRALKNDPAQGYVLQLPRKYSAENKAPLLIVVHWYQGTAMQQIDEWRFLAQKNGYILLAPQFTEGYQRLGGGCEQKLKDIISEVENEYSVDQDKIFLLGFSGGAQFAHRFAYRNHFLKAVCILSPGDCDSPPSEPSAKSVRYFVGAGEEDPRYPVAKKLYKLLEKKGYDVTFKSFPSVGHTLHSSIKSEAIDFLNSSP